MSPRFLFAVAVLAGAAFPAGPGALASAAEISKGDALVTIHADASVMDGAVLLLKLGTGVEIVAEDVQGDWILVRVDRGGQKVAGWVHRQYVARPALPRTRREFTVVGDEIGPRYVIYDEGQGPDFSPSGWMPDGRALAQDVRCTDTPHHGKYCVRTKCRFADAAEGWAGIAWLLDGQWFPTRKLDLFQKLGAKRGDPIVLRFWARSKAGASIEFSAGGGRGDSIRMKRFAGAIDVPAGPGGPLAKLDGQWRQFQVDLTGADLSHVVQIFASTAPLFGVPALRDFEEAWHRAPEDQQEAKAQEWQKRAEEARKRAVVEWDVDEIYIVKVRERPPRAKHPDWPDLQDLDLDSDPDGRVPRGRMEVKPPPGADLRDFAPDEGYNPPVPVGPPLAPPPAPPPVKPQ